MTTRAFFNFLQGKTNYKRKSRRKKNIVPGSFFFIASRSLFRKFHASLSRVVVVAVIDVSSCCRWNERALRRRRFRRRRLCRMGIAIVVVDNDVKPSSSSSTEATTTSTPIPLFFILLNSGRVRCFEPARGILCNCPTCFERIETIFTARERTTKGTSSSERTKRRR